MHVIAVAITTSSAQGANDPHALADAGEHPVIVHAEPPTEQLEYLY